MKMLELLLQFHVGILRQSHTNEMHEVADGTVLRKAQCMSFLFQENVLVEWDLQLVLFQSGRLTFASVPRSSSLSMG